MLNQTFIDELKDYIDNAIYSSDYLCYSPASEDILVYSPEIISQDIEDYIGNNRQPVLNQVLFDLIDKRGLTDAQVYNKAGLDRKLFSKIRTNPSYKPKKNTLVSIAFALKLSDDEFDSFLETAGYSLSNSDTQDLIIKFFLEKKRYDIDELHEAFDRFIPKKQHTENPLTSNAVLLETLKTIPGLQLNKHVKSNMQNGECVTRKPHHRRKNVIGDISSKGTYFTLYKNGAWTSRNKLGITTIEQVIKHVKSDIAFLSR